MLAIANWCLAVVQGTIRSWVPLGFPSLAIRPVPNAGECPKFLHWGHAEALSEPRGFSYLGAEKGRHSASGAASCGCCPMGVVLEEV